MTPFTLHRAGRTLLVRIVAPLSGGPSVEWLRGEMARHRAKALLVDATAAPYADSDGLRWLLSLQSACDTDGRNLRIVARQNGKVWRNVRLLNANLALFGSGRAAWRDAAR